MYKGAGVKRTRFGALVGFDHLFSKAMLPARVHNFWTKKNMEVAVKPAESRSERSIESGRLDNFRCPLVTMAHARRAQCNDGSLNGWGGGLSSLAGVGIHRSRHNVQIQRETLGHSDKATTCKAHIVVNQRRWKSLSGLLNT